MIIEYSKSGRMLYNPKFHSRHKMKWTREEIKYLIDWYYIIGPEEISFALDRTIDTIMCRADMLRKQGKLIRPNKVQKIRRVPNE